MLLPKQDINMNCINQSFFEVPESGRSLEGSQQGLWADFNIKCIDYLSEQAVRSAVCLCFPMAFYQSFPSSGQRHSQSWDEQLMFRRTN